MKILGKKFDYVHWNCFMYERGVNGGLGLTWIGIVVEALILA